jgi:N-acetylmuramoyl-L-alanine amidase
MFKTLSIGMKGHDVAVLQAGLNISLPDASPLAVDGIFWTLTQGRVKEFQRQNQLKTDGIVGPLTWGKLLEAGSDPGSEFLCEPSCDNGNPEHEGSAGLVDSAAASALTSPAASTSGKPAMLLGFSIPLPSVPSLPKLRPYKGSPEEGMGTAVYGSSIDSSTVFLSDKTGYDDRAFTLTIPPTLLTPLKIIMNVGPTLSTSAYHDTIIHELGHVWQAQHATNPTLYMANSVKSQAMAEAANLALSVLLKKKVKAFSAYAYRPGKKFSEYAAEQIAEQAENGETAIIAHMKAVAPGRIDPENDTGLSTPQIEDTRSPGVKI